MKQLLQFILLVIMVVIATFLSFLIFKAEAEAPVKEIKVPETVQNNPIKEFAYNQVKLRWDESQWNSFNNIVERESQWNSDNQNPSSSAYGLGQFLNSTWQGTGYKKTSDPNIQIMAMIEYIANRYGSPDNAWSFWKTKAWY